MENKTKKNIGALWLKKSKNGTSYLSGSITTPDGEQVNVIVFKNTYKTESKHPDYKIFPDEKPEKNDIPQAQSATVKQKPTSTAKNTGQAQSNKPVTPEVEESMETDDIPF